MEPDPYTSHVTTAAKKVGLLSPTGALLQVDSLTLIDFVVELEDASGIRIDVAELTAESFESIQTVAAMLKKLDGGAASP